MAENLKENSGPVYLHIYLVVSIYVYATHFEVLYWHQAQIHQPTREKIGPLNGQQAAPIHIQRRTNYF